MAKIIVFDFDGVLAEAGKWEGHKKIGPPQEKWIRILKRLYAAGWVIRISTCRLNPAPFLEPRVDPDVDSGYAELCVRDWLSKHGLSGMIASVTGDKPYGDIYVDDRALGFKALDVLDEDTLLQLIEGVTEIRFPVEVPPVREKVPAKRYEKSYQETPQGLPAADRHEAAGRPLREIRLREGPLEPALCEQSACELGRSCGKAASDNGIYNVKEMLIEVRPRGGRPIEGEPERVKKRIIRALGEHYNVEIMEAVEHDPEALKPEYCVKDLITNTTKCSHESPEDLEAKEPGFNGLPKEWTT